MQKLIAIVGPTATGKSSVAVELAKNLKGEIISADSAQVYRGLNIGTAKIRAEEKRGIAHHLLDIVGPEREYTVGQFQKEAVTAIKEIACRGHMPILCGGSGLYINSILYPTYDFSEGQGDENTRNAYQTLKETRGLDYLYELLEDKYPRRAKKIHPHDAQRILRALEMGYDLRENEKNSWHSTYDVRIFGLSRERKNLYEAIEKRVDEMFSLGLVNEVEAALTCGYAVRGNAMSALGYKEVIPYIEGKCTLEESVALLKKNTRHFAKRQMTWFRRDPNITWLSVDEYNTLGEIAANIFQHLKQENFF